MESKLLYIFNDLAKENNIAIRFSFRFFITVLQNKKRKWYFKNSFGIFSSDLIIWVCKLRYIGFKSPDLGVRGKEIGLKSPDLGVRGKSPDLGVGGKEFAVFNVCKWTISIVYARGLSPFLVGTQVCVCVR